MNRYTLTALTENTPGVLHRITAAFTRRSVNIESLTVSETERHGISRFTVVFLAEDDQVEKLVKPIRRIVEVISAVAHQDQELLFKEIAFLRVAIESQQERDEIEQAAFEQHAFVVMTDGKSLVLEKTGTEDEINLFRGALAGFKIMTFIRSGRIAINRLEGDRPIGRLSGVR